VQLGGVDPEGFERGGEHVGGPGAVELGAELGEQRAQVLRPHAGAVGPLGAHVDRTDIAE